MPTPMEAPSPTPPCEITIGSASPERSGRRYRHNRRSLSAEWHRYGTAGCTGYDLVWIGIGVLHRLFLLLCLVEISVGLEGSNGEFLLLCVRR
jgi:hypothetical protein